MAQGGVEAATGVGNKGGEAYRRVAVAAISKTPNERMRTKGCVLVAGRLVARAQKPTAVFQKPLVLPPSVKEPTAVLSAPLVLLPSALEPLAVLSLPVVLSKSAPTPVAVLPSPIVLAPRANAPSAVLPTPVVLAPRANTPLAVLSLPVVLRKRAYIPLAVFWIPSCCYRVHYRRWPYCCRPVVFKDSALTPMAVLRVPMVLTFERRETNRRIVCAAGETQKGVLPFCRVPPG